MITCDLVEVFFLFLFLQKISSGRKTISLRSLHYDVRVRSRLVESDVTAVYSNTRKNASHGQVFLPLPEEAYITSLSLQIDGKNFTGILTKKKKEKKSIYNQEINTVQLHHRSGRAQRFTINTFLNSSNTLKFRYSYTEALHRRKGHYPLIFFIPKQAVKNLKINLLIQEVQKLTSLKFLFSNGEDDELIKIKQGEVKVDILNENEVRFSYEDFGRKAGFFIQGGSDQVSFESGKESHLILSDPGFVFLYDIARFEDAGEIQIQNKHFVHFIAPEGLPKLAVHTVFVLDISGSMDELKKLDNLKLAMIAILKTLRSEDSFEVFVFSNGVKSLGVFTASKRDVTRGSNKISGLRAYGGTNMNDALQDAVKSVNRRKFKKSAMQIVFLTDGRPTIGVKDPEKIRKNLKDSNNEVFSVYTLGFGNDADMRFLRQISSENRGFARKISSDGRPSDQLRDFYEEISTPLMTDLEITYDPSEVERDSIVKYGQDNFYSGDEIVVTGKLQEGVKDLHPRVEGNSRGGRIQLKLPRKQTLESPPTQETLLLERIWGYLAVQDLLSSQELIEDAGVRKEMKARALELALRYNFVTKLTSMVMVEQQDNLYYFHSSEEALGLEFPHTGESVGASSTANQDQYTTGGHPKVTPEVFGVPPYDHMHRVMPPSTNRRYSFVDNDPHFVVQVPGLELPLCFDLHGHPGDILSLVEDVESGVTVNAEVSAAIGRPRATYFTKIYISVEGLEIIVDPKTIKVKCPVEDGQLKISDVWQETDPSLNTRRRRIGSKKKHARQTRLKKSYPSRKKRHKRRWLKKIRANACMSGRWDSACIGVNPHRARRRPRNAPMEFIRKIFERPLSSCLNCNPSNSLEAEDPSGFSKLVQAKREIGVEGPSEETFFESSSPYIDAYLEKSNKKFSPFFDEKSHHRDTLKHSDGNHKRVVESQSNHSPEINRNYPSDTLEDKFNSKIESAIQNGSMSANHCNQSVTWEELSRTSYDDILLIVKGRKRRRRLDVIVGDVKVHFVVMNTRNKAGQSFLGFYIQEQTILSPSTSGVIGQFVYKSVGTIGYFPELLKDPESLENNSIPLAVVHLPQGGDAHPPRVSEVESVVSRRRSLLHRTKVLCLHVRKHGKGLLSRPASAYLLPCLSCRL